MKLEGWLPGDRQGWGELAVIADDGTVLFGPRSYRGKADNQAAIVHGNPTRDPLRSFGNHAFGQYRVTEVVKIDPADTLHFGEFGPYKLRLDPIGGDALQAKRNGRTDLELHGGAPGQPGTLNELRATYGCARTSDDTITHIAGLVTPELAVGREVQYDCRLGP